MATWIVAIAITIVVVVIIAIFNGIISRANMVQRAWANIITQERQKNKIIPHLEELTGEYKSFEQSVLKQVTELRTAIMELDDSDMNTAALNKAQTKTKDLVSGIKVAVEDYPELKASDVYNNLMKEITEQQENIGAAIKIFNQNVELFNTGIEIFPNSLVNSLFNKKVKVKTFSDSEVSKEFEYNPNFE